MTSELATICPGRPECGPDAVSGFFRIYTIVMKFRIVLEFDSEVGSFSATCPELPGCASAGDTEEEARRNIEEAIKLYLAPAEISVPDNAKLLEVTIG